MRLAKYLAHAGVASRRRAEELIAKGAISVNDAIVRDVAVQVAENDRVTYDGVSLDLPAKHRYIVLHKPLQVVTTMHDPQKRRTVASLLPRNEGRVVPVGRLDYQTSGVLLLTDDGDLAYLLTHPRYGVEKTYRAVVRGRVLPTEIERLTDGIALSGDRPAEPAKIRVVRSSRERSELDVTIHEGRNRQVRRMLAAAGHPVLSLTRLRFGPVALGDLPPGQWRDATAREVAALGRIRNEAQASC